MTNLKSNLWVCTNLWPYRTWKKYNFRSLRARNATVTKANVFLTGICQFPVTNIYSLTSSTAKVIAFLRSRQQYISCNLHRPFSLVFFSVKVWGIGFDFKYFMTIHWCFYKNRTNECIWSCVNLLQYKWHKPPTCFSHLCGHLQGGKKSNHFNTFVVVLQFNCTIYNSICVSKVCVQYKLMPIVGLN